MKKFQRTRNVVDGHNSRRSATAPEIVQAIEVGSRTSNRNLSRELNKERLALI